MKKENILKEKKNLLLFIIIIILPILDVISYFLMEKNLNVITTVFRFLLLTTIFLTAFIVSKEKKKYLICLGILAVYWIIHVLNYQFLQGYKSFFSDMAMFIRVAQLPIYTLTFITFFKKCKEWSKVIQTAFVVNYGIILIVIILSYLTNKIEYTYHYHQVGIKGWFAYGNAQTAIIVALSGLAFYFAIWKKNIFLSILIPTVITFFFYFTGTRVAFYSGIIELFVILGTLLIKKYDYRPLCIVLLILLVSFTYFKGYAPVNIPHSGDPEINMRKEPTPEEIKKFLAFVAELQGEYGTGNAEIDKYFPLYLENNLDLIQRFGLERTVKAYNYSVERKDLNYNNRIKKQLFGKLVMEEMNPRIRVTGFEYKDLEFMNGTYDLENDFHSILYSYGYLGLSLLILFLGYFPFIVFKYLIKKKSFNLTTEMIIVCLTYALLIATAYFASYVIRRPNVSIYLAIILAYIYVLVTEDRVVEEKDEENLVKIKSPME